MKYFDHFPVEIRMMVFDHLVTEKISLGTICLVSHNWKIITQNSYAWKLWINAYIGKKTQLALEYVNDDWDWGVKNRTYPIIYVQCVPHDILSNHSKMLLVKKFLFSFLKNNDIKHSIWSSMTAGVNGKDDKIEILYVWRKLIYTCNNVKLLQIFQKYFNITADNVRADNNRALLVTCSNGHLEVLKYLHIQFGLTTADARDDHIPALTISCENGHLEVVEYLHKAFKLDADDARFNLNEALRIACKYGHLLVVKYLHIKFGLDDNDARAINNCALRWACRESHWDIIDYLHEDFELTAADANDSMNWLRMNTDKANIDYLCKVFGLIADEI